MNASNEAFLQLPFWSWKQKYKSFPFYDIKNTNLRPVWGCADGNTLSQKWENRWKDEQYLTDNLKLNSDFVQVNHKHKDKYTGQEGKHAVKAGNIKPI